MNGSEHAALLAELSDRLRRITETPAPPFQERARGDLVAELWRAAGLPVARDEVGNVVAQLPGGHGPRVLVAAHLDTVFGPEVDVRVREEGARLAAPGIGDDSAGLAVLTVFVERLGRGEGAAATSGGAAAARPRLTIAATVGEEGLGDLRGARHLVARHGAEHDLFVALDGRLGTLVTGAVGSSRFELRFRGEGGHSWGDYPSPSAVHAAGEAIHGLVRLKLPATPRTTLNVGQVWGGTSINAIAEEAGFNLDVRSVDAGALQATAQAARLAVQRAARRQGCAVTITQVGDRPVAQVDSSALIAGARDALAAVGIAAHEVVSSTDANAALAAGLPAIAFGVSWGGDAHRLSEWLEPASLPLGYAAFGALLASLAKL